MLGRGANEVSKMRCPVRHKERYTIPFRLRNHVFYTLNQKVMYSSLQLPNIALCLHTKDYPEDIQRGHGLEYQTFDERFPESYHEYSFEEMASNVFLEWNQLQKGYRLKSTRPILLRGCRF